MKITITPGARPGAWRVDVEGLPQEEHAHLMVAAVLATATKQILDVALDQAMKRPEQPSIQIARPDQLPPAR